MTDEKREKLKQIFGIDPDEAYKDVDWRREYNLACARISHADEEVERLRAENERLRALLDERESVREKTEREWDGKADLSALEGFSAPKGGDDADAE